MNKISKILLLTSLLLVLSFGFSTAYAYENFEIETYIVNVNVLENNVFEVEEIIYADFTYESHGIYREIPITGIFSRTVDDEHIETKYHAKISDVDVENHKFTSKKQGNYQIIKIGDKNKWIYGMQKYRITYTLDFGEDGISDFDEFYFNIIGTGWGAYINNVAATITMPKEFNAEEIGVSTGYAGASGSSITQYEVDGNKIILYTTDILYPHEGMTMRIHLPEGYFVDERQPINWLNIFYYCVGALVFVVLLALVTIGRDDKLYPSVEFYPPEDLPPAEAGYIIDGYLDTKDVLSLLIYWADKGYIKIVEVKNNDYYLVKLKPLDDNAEEYEQRLFIDLFKNRTEEDFSDLVEKVQKKENLSVFYNYLVEKQNNNESLTYVRIKDLQNVFYTTIEAVKSKIKRKYTDKQQGRIYTNKSILAKVLTFIVCTLPIYFGNILITAQKSLYMDDAVIGGLFWCGFMLTIFIILDQVVARRKSRKRRSNTVLAIVFSVILFGIGYLSFIIMAETIDEKMTAYVAIAAAYAMAFSGMFMEKCTPRVNELKEKILGLRMFLLDAEQDRIERLVHDNPDYFFNILSYAYVLGVTDEWAKQFESIAIRKPDWYESSTMRTHFAPMAFTRSFTQGVNTMRYTMTSRPSSSGSSSSGGYSGGGGFSGGGGGGGGGGSW